MNLDAAVVIATYNEAETIGLILEALSEFVVIVVDDNSPDGTAEIASHYANARVIVRKDERGIASAYLRGMHTALMLAAPYVVQMDAGGTHDPDDIWPILLNAKRRDADLVIGSRFVCPPPLLSYRTFISLTATKLMQIRGLAVRDATSGLRVWRREVLRHVIEDGVKARGHAFNLELLWNAHRIRARIFEFPIVYRLTNSSLRPWMLFEALRVVGAMR